jgi:hypothetical protein
VGRSEKRVVRVTGDGSAVCGGAAGLIQHVGRLDPIG